MKNPPIRSIEDIFDECITALHTQNASIFDCLSRHPENRSELEPLLQTAITLQSAQAVSVSPEFRRVAATRLNNLITAQSKPIPDPVPKPTLSTWERFRSSFYFGKWRVATAVIAVVIFTWILIGTQVVSASQNAYPGDPLYAVKRTVETTQLNFTTNIAQEAELHLKFAQERVDELAVIMQQNEPEIAEQLLADYESQLQASLNLLESETTLTKRQKENLATQLISTIEIQQADLSDLLWQATPNLQPSIQASLNLTASGHNTLLMLVSTNPKEPLPIIHPTTTPTETSTPSPTKTKPPTHTPSPTQTNTPVPTPLPATSARPVWPTSQPRTALELPNKCQPPAHWTNEWPDDICSLLTAIPTDLPPPPTIWPTVPPSPAWQPPPDWPEECPNPTEWTDEWPEGCPLPPDPTADESILPEEWPPVPPPDEDGWVNSPEDLPPPPDDWTPPDDGDGWVNSPEDLPPPPDDWSLPDDEGDGDDDSPSGWGWP